jgi:hypothetical protein
VAGRSAIAVLVILVAGVAGAQSLPGIIEGGALPVSWVTGASCPETPAFRIHEYNPDFFILRQSGCTNFEKPFLYLLFCERGACSSTREHRRRMPPPPSGRRSIAGRRVTAAGRLRSSSCIRTGTAITSPSDAQLRAERTRRWSPRVIGRAHRVFG